MYFMHIKAVELGVLTACVRCSVYDSNRLAAGIFFSRCLHVNVICVCTVHVRVRVNIYMLLCDLRPETSVWFTIPYHMQTSNMNARRLRDFTVYDINPEH